MRCVILFAILAITAGSSDPDSVVPEPLQDPVAPEQMDTVPKVQALATETSKVSVVGEAVIEKFCKHRGAKAFFSALQGGYHTYRKKRRKNKGGYGERIYKHKMAKRKKDREMKRKMVKHLKLEKGGKFPYYSQADIDKPPEGNKYSKAVIVVHGAMRDADDYFCSMKTLVGEGEGTDLNNTLVIAPQFSFKRDHIQKGVVFWKPGSPAGDWKAGGTYSSHATGTPISSFAVLDQMLAQIAHNYPGIQQIIVAGHSAGGQTVQRYALTTHVNPAGEEIEGYLSLKGEPAVHYIVANPSSYAYLDNRRFPYTCGEDGCNEIDESKLEVPTAQVTSGPRADYYYPKHAKIVYDGYNTWMGYKSWGKEKVDGQPESQPVKTKPWICRDDSYNAWQYGLEGAHKVIAPYVPANISIPIKAYAKRDVRYLLGEGDQCNDVLFRYSAEYGRQCFNKCWTKNWGCARTIMDARCPAMLQGPWRYRRGQNYFKYLTKYCKEKGLKLHHSIYSVPKVGHQAQKMFTSKVGIKALFGHGKD